MVVIAAGVAGGIEYEDHKSTAHNSAATSTTLLTPPTTVKPVPPPPVGSALSAPLGVPITEPLVLKGTGAQLLIIGGAVSNGTPASGGFLFDTTTGALHLAVDLVGAGVYDASGAGLGSEDFIFGGKGPSVTSSVQSFPAPGLAAPTATTASSPATALPSGPGGSSSSTATTARRNPVATATYTAALPAPRAGSVAVRVGTAIYIVGGYHGTSAEGGVLTTLDGATFTTIATLPVAVRDAGVAAVGGNIYVFGGERLAPLGATPATPPVTKAKGSATKPGTVAKAAAATRGTGLGAQLDASIRLAAPTGKGKGAATAATTHPAVAHPAAHPAALAWSPTDYIQKVSPVTGKATVIGHLPAALEGLIAVTVDGHIYVTGGDGPAGVNGVIWGFEPQTGALLPKGHLSQPVYDAGSAVLGDTAWLIGGQGTGGRLLSTVQTFRLTSGAARTAATG